jgi:Skp family chaperone for outer membrane proteins
MIASRRGFIAGTLALAGRAGVCEQNGVAPLRLGVVNVRSCFDKERYSRMAEEMEELGKFRQQLSQEAIELQRKIAVLTEKMEGTPTQGELYVDKLRLRAHAEYDLKLLQEVARRKLRDRVGDLETRVYADLRRVVAQVARAQNIDLMLRVDGPRLPEEDSEVAAFLKGASHEVLFHHDALDLTALVLAGLNADWAKAWTCAVCRRKVPDEKCPDCGAKKP